MAPQLGPRGIQLRIQVRRFDLREDLPCFTRSPMSTNHLRDIAVDPRVNGARVPGRSLTGQREVLSGAHRRAVTTSTIRGVFSVGRRIVAQRTRMQQIRDEASDAPEGSR